MTYKNKKQRLLFVVNQGSGNRDESLSEKIINHFADSETSIEIFELPANAISNKLKKQLQKRKLIE